MKRIIFALCVFVFTSNLRAGPLEQIAPYVGGEWRIDGAWKAGEPLKARETYEWSVGKKFIIAKTYISSPKGEYQRYETIFGEQDGKLMAWAFVYDGTSDVNEFTANGKKLSSSHPIPNQAESILHQSIELVGPDKFRWLVSIEKDGKNDAIMDGEWIRSQEVTHPELHFAKNPPSAEDKLLEIPAALVGDWKVDAKWNDGRPLSATASYAWGPGKKFVTAKTTILKPDGSIEYQRYYTVFGVRDGKLTAFHFIFDGTTDFAPQTIDGKRMGSVRTFKHDGNESSVNQFVELIDANTLHWKVWTGADGEAKPMMDSNWKRIEK